MPDAPPRNVRDYAVVTVTYWAFTVTDGALRMLVLLYLHEQGYTPLALASVFILYECCGMFTNLVGGFVGARFGLNTTLFAGLSLQIGACVVLAGLANALTVPLVMILQALSGIAKDLTKMSSKSYVKLVVPEADGSRLMRWVSLITGSKNTLKGVGFFVGGFLLTHLGFREACLVMAGGLALALVTSASLLPGAAGRAGAKAKFGSVFSSDMRINWLAAARLFLFGSRDVWFAVALPVFLASQLGWSFSAVGGFLASWVIGYGFVQASAPRFAGSGRDTSGRLRPPTAQRLGAQTLLLAVPLCAIALALHRGADPSATLIVGLLAFGALFAVNSAVHSYLIVAYAASETVAMNVGFYYMANAAGRLLGTVASGGVFELGGAGQGGLIACLVVSTGFVLVSSLLCVPLANVEAAANRPSGDLSVSPRLD